MHPDKIEDIEVAQPSPATRRHIRRGITLPLFIGFILLATFVVVIIVLGFGGIGVWADVSLVFIIFPMLLVGLLILIFLSAVLYGVWRLSAWALSPLQRAQTYAARAVHITRRSMDLTAKPVIVLSGLAAGLARIGRRMRRRKRNVEG
jgi:hypothetical protein